MTLVFYYQYASSAYGIFDPICLKPNGNTMVKTFSISSTDTQGFIARDDTRKEVVVCFRGSLSVQDALTDADQVLIPFASTGTSPPSNTLVHMGFLDAWNSASPTVLATVSSQLAAFPGYTIVTTGHSLGGSLSSLAAISLKENFPDSAIRMYTYGQPRTGNPIYAAWVDDNFGSTAFRTTHTDDGVPTVIPTELGYQHHGIEYWQNPDPASAATTKECSGDEDPTCSASIPSSGINAAHISYFGILTSTPFCS